MRYISLIALPVLVGLPLPIMSGSAEALPGSYAHITRKWCDAHWNDDRTTRIECDPTRSKANLKLPHPTVSIASLRAGPDLTPAEARAECLGSNTKLLGEFGCALMRWQGKGGKATDLDDNLLPPGVKTAKLALRAHIAIYLFKMTVVKVGIDGGQRGEMAVSWNVPSVVGRELRSGRRKSETIHLTNAEIEQIVTALNASLFWQLPDEPRHEGAADGELASVEVSIPGWRHHVLDPIGDSEAVDLSILVNALSTVIHNHLPGVPGG